MSEEMNPEAPILFRHPEWKRLYDALADQLAPGQLWKYPELNILSGMDIRGSRGRRQFLRCRDEILKKRGWWMENVRDEGYRVIHPDEQPDAAMKRVRQGQRRIRKGGKVAAYAKFELMKAEMARVAADMSVRISMLEKQVAEVIKVTRKQIGSAEPKRLPHPLLNDLQQAAN